MPELAERLWPNFYFVLISALRSLAEPLVVIPAMR
jgi:hypothetical protein